MKRSAIDPEKGRSALPTTYGGDRWRQRPQSLSQEITEGKLWHRCGYTSESSDLLEVVLSWPSETLEVSCDPDEILMLECPNLSVIRRQADALADFYRSRGIHVNMVCPDKPPPPNFLFQRDLFWATPEGIILGRPAPVQRAGEERWAAAALAKIGVPIVMSPRGTAVFEGADALWLAPKTVLLGIGKRTNREAARQLSAFLQEIDVRLIEITLPRGCQHLLGVVNFISGDLAAVHERKLTTELTGILEHHNIETVRMPDNDDVNRRLAMNFVTLSPREIVMPAGAPAIGDLLGKHGVTVFTVECSEYLKAAGGLGCATGILRRKA